MSHTSRYLLAVIGGFVPDLFGSYKPLSPESGTYQVIPSGTWTRVAGVDAEVFQESGRARVIIVQRDRLIVPGMGNARTSIILRPPGGAYPAHGWIPPLQGVWWVQEVPQKGLTNAS